MKISFLLTFFILATTSLIFISCGKTKTPATVVAPTISSISPVKDSIGGRITITGDNFSSTTSGNIVKFNGISATVISATATQLVVTVPSGILSVGAITVTVLGKTANSASNFTVVSSIQLLISGQWNYVSSQRTDSFTNGLQTFHYNSTGLGSDFLNFTDSGKVYFLQNGWGYGQSGAVYRDTINYVINGNNIFLSYPSSTKNFFDVGTSTYPAYSDTINIINLNSTSLEISRNYHYKHTTLYNNEIKFSIDSLKR
jgi:IPT/TIG domain